MKRRSINYKYLLAAVAILLLTSIPFLALNKSFYGGYFKTGLHVGLRWKNTIPPPGNQPVNLIENVKLMANAMPLFILPILGALYCLCKKRAVAYVAYFPIPVFLFTYFLLTGFRAQCPILLHNSYIRYFLPIYVLCVPLFVEFVLGISRRKILAVFAVFMFVLMGIQATYPAMVSNREVALKYSEIAETIFANTESDSVILCQYFDKMLFPKRKVGIISSLQQDPKLLANITATLKQNNVPVYILVDGPISLQQFDGELSKRDYFLRLVDPASKLYRVQEGVD